jgi:predicted Zn-dependent protease
VGEGSVSVERTIRTTDCGIPATRRWYLREVDLRTILYAGLTRDGTRVVEDGEIVKSIRNMCFNESPLFTV